MANVGGNVSIDVGTGTITYTNGTGPHSTATIGNFTGTGTTTGSLTGANPPSEVQTNPTVTGFVASQGSNTPSPTNSQTTISTIQTIVVNQPDTNPGATNLGPNVSDHAPGLLASLEGGGDSSEPNTADSATVVIADSLDGTKKPTGTQLLLGGMVKQVAPTAANGTPHGVPPADQDFSSWGNEALWQ
ncbi:MAG: hypothetical protein JO348_12415 [Alphaproteobacteria bacterium]|nr:hypothetical protein [Alphaproteobacteria bacterium]